MLSLLACLCMATPVPDSLRKPLQDLQALYERKSPNAQLDTGDLFFATDKAQIDEAVKAGKIGKRDMKPFAGDQVCLLVSDKAKNRVTSLQDLTQPGIRICMAKDQEAVSEVLSRAAKRFGPTWLDQVRVKVVSFEPSVSAVMTRVELSDVDAGFVYETDARQAKKAIGYQIPKEFAVRTIYYCGVLKAAKNPTGAKAFIDLATGKEGQAILARYGFLPPK